jgi:hypothetical protein
LRSGWWYITDTVGVAGVWELEKLAGVLCPEMGVDVVRPWFRSERVPDSMNTLQIPNTVSS